MDCIQDALPPTIFFETLPSLTGGLWRVDKKSLMVLSAWQGIPAFSHDGQHLAYTCVQNMEHRTLASITVAISDVSQTQSTTVGGTITGSGVADGSGLDTRRQEVEFPRWIGFREERGNLRIDRTDACRWLASWNSARTERDLADDAQRGDKLAYATYSFQSTSAERSVES